jgi:hypothetical protein
VQAVNFVPTRSIQIPISDDANSFFLNGINSYNTFDNELKRIFTRLVNGKNADEIKIDRMLNGGAFEELKAVVSRTDRQRFGIFFTGHELAKLAASKVKNKLSAGASFADPSCGAGDLILACLAHTPLANTISETLENWGGLISGVELHPELASVTRRRIALYAASKIKPQIESGTGKNRAPKYLKNIVAGDFLSCTSALKNVDCVVMNPPFGAKKFEKKYKWGKGLLQLAGVFVWEVLEAAKAGQEIVAVLPDVLRSGSRYIKWRAQVAELAEVIEVQPIGQFDEDADVDVFILHLKKKGEKSTEPKINWGFFADSKKITKTVEEDFRVSVGAVVPHRHKGNKGSWHPYLNVASAPFGLEISSLTNRRFEGSLHQGPFLVLRRTSSPRDKNRVVMSFYLGNKKVAIENHLIVFQPLDGKIESCKQLADILRRQSTREWLDKQIRCRHLTTGICKQIPQ